MSAGDFLLHQTIARTARRTWRTRARVESVIEAVAIVLIGAILLEVFS